jgi:uncharacterized protein (DUF885 family)
MTPKKIISLNSPLKNVFIALLAAGALVACQPASDSRSDRATVETSYTAEEIQAETAKLNEWFETQFEEELEFSPIQQTFLGRRTNYDKIGDFSAEAQAKQLQWKRDSVAKMQADFDYNKLSDDAKISWDIWKYQLDADEAADKFRTNGYVFDQMSAVHSFVPQFMIAFHEVEEASHLDAYVKRISAASVALHQLIELSKESAATGVRPPKFAFDSVIEESGKIISGAPFSDGEDSAIWADFKEEVSKIQETGEIDQAEADALLDAAKSALIKDWQPAFEALIAWQEEDIVNTAEIGTGVGALPNGVAYYNERLANNTTTGLTADEIHNIGLKEVARLRGEMEAIKDKVGFEGTLQEFFVELRDKKDDPRYYYPNTDEGRQGYIDDATAAIDRIKTELPNYFGIMPKADMVVKRVEAFREQPGAAQHYFPSTPDGSRPGIYYAHLSDMKAMPKRELEVIAYHEGLPGHHMQIAIQQELESVPTFRTQAGFTAYSEGWGLYSEWLATEIPGSYADPYSDFGRLGSEIWRAIRLVVDTGLHSKGWTEEQAIEYFQANSAVTDGQARSEVRRYMVLPGQATSYKIGMLKIQELRRNAETELGDKFDIKAFHDTVLGGGALPLSILERRVNQWIRDVKAQ